LRTWIAVYPCATLVVGVCGDWLHDLPLPLRTLASSALIVPLVVNVGAPLVERLATASAAIWRGKASYR
jgi:antibiotic biosynthesis monooxygenase (ABM) superfamily enzyme